MNIYVENAGNIYAKYVNVVLKIPTCCIRGNTYDQRDQNTEEIKADNTVRDLVAPYANWHYQDIIERPKHYGPARHEPVLPGTRVLLTAIPINDFSTDPGNNITWSIYADNALPESGKIEFGNMNRF